MLTEEEWKAFGEKATTEQLLKLVKLAEDVLVAHAQTLPAKETCELLASMLDEKIKHTVDENAIEIVNGMCFIKPNPAHWG